MSGITTTPHLHFQVDNDDAPFHPYWAFSMEEAGAAGMSFFDAVSLGLNKERLQDFTVDPIDFVLNATSIDGKSSAKNTEKSSKVTKAPKIVTEFLDIDTSHTSYEAIMYFAKK